MPLVTTHAFRHSLAAAVLALASPVRSQDLAAPKPDDGAVSAYQRQVLVQARRHKGYPKSAVAAGLEGQVIVVVNVTKDGATSVQIETSSGHSSLDASALAMVKAAVSDVTLPDSLHGQAFIVRVPVTFSLE